MEGEPQFVSTNLYDKYLSEYAEDNVGSHQSENSVGDNGQQTSNYRTPASLSKAFNFEREADGNKGQGEEPDAQ